MALWDSDKGKGKEKDMKKLLVILLCIAALFAVVSCKQPEPEPEPQGTPEPKWEAGVIRVKPAEGATFSQSGKFQFQLALVYNAGQPISFLAKFSEDITAITVRQGGGDNTRFISDLPIASFDTDADGWSIITIPGSSVTPMDTQVPVESWINLGITLRAPDTTREYSWVGIKGLSINEVPVDFTTWDLEDDYIIPYYTSPDKLDIKIVKEQEI